MCYVSPVCQWATTSPPTQHVTYVSSRHALLQMNPFSHFLSVFFFFYVTALSFIGQARQLDSSVSCTKETKWNRGRAVMSNSSYSVTYRPATVWGSLLETMEGFERSGALWSPSLIAFPGTGLQCWGWLWSGSCGFREGGGAGEDPPLRWPFTGTGGVEWKGLEEERAIVVRCECRGGTQ